MNDAVDVDFNPEEAKHIKAIIRRAHWLEQRMATSDPTRGGATFDQLEYEALLWALYEVGAEYIPGPYAETEAAEQPPLRVAEEWRPASPAGFRSAARPRSRYMSE